LITSLFGTHSLASSHGLPRPLKYEQGVTFQPSVAAPTAALIFIHGYGGDALSTWANFGALLPLREKCDKHDLFFYEYDGIESELKASIGLTRRLLIAIAEQPHIVAGGLDQPRAGFNYERIVVVGHSLGCVLARGALLECLEMKKPWARNVDLVLYAPAHVGARVDRLAASVYRGYAPLTAAASLAKFKSPLIEQLAEGSKPLKDLAYETQKAFKRGNLNVIPRLIVTAQKEHVVVNDRFVQQDPLAEPIIGTYHETVCKPRLDFLAPLDLLLGAMR